MPTENLLEDQSAEQLDPNVSYLEQLVGEGKKFKSPEDLAKGKYIGDSYITVLEKRLDDYRAELISKEEQLKAAATLEKLKRSFEAKQLASSEHTPANEVREPSLKPEDIDSRFEKKIREYEQSQIQTANRNRIKDKLTERYGSNYAAQVKQQIESLGLTSDDFETLARTKPDLLIKSLGLDQQQRREPFQAPPKSSSDFRPTGEKKRTWSYYKELKKNNREAWLDPKTSVQMQNDVIEMGEEAFYDVD